MPPSHLILAGLAASAVLAACSHRDDGTQAGTQGEPKPVGATPPLPASDPPPAPPEPKPAGPPPQNPNTAVRVDLSRAKATTYHSVSTGGRHIALTFDDGPHRTNTPRLLDILKERNIKATFFVVGARVKSHPAIVRRMIAEGHEVANHTMTHGDLSGMTDVQIRTELDGCHAAIVAACGVAPRLMRAPYGSLKNAQKIFIKDTWGYPNIHWSVDPKDHERPGPSVVAKRILSNTKAGGIVLVHDIHAPSIVAMPQALDGLLSKGFSFVTVSQLISLGNQPVASMN